MSRRFTGIQYDYLKIADTFPAVGYSISMWVRTYEFAGGGCTFFKGHANASYAWSADYCGPSDTQIGALTGVGSTFVGASVTQAFNLNEWYHVLMVYTAADKRECWVNGTLYAINTVHAGHIYPQNCLVLGGLLLTDPVVYAPYRGDIADVGFWNTALNATDAAELFAGRPGDVKAGNLQGWWKFAVDGGLENSVPGYGPFVMFGSVPAIDDPPYSVAGTGDIKTVSSVPVASIKTFLTVPRASIKTINSLPMGGGGEEISPDDIAGLQAWYRADLGVYSSSAAKFTLGNSEYLTIPDTVSLRLGNIPFTIGGWMYLDGTMAAASVWIEKRSGSTIDYEIYYDYASSLVNFIHGASSITSSSMPINGWHFVVIVHTPGAGATIQIDNGTVSAPTAATAPPVTAGELTIGSSHSPLGNWLNGRQQNWFIFGRALSATERTFLYNAGNGRSYEELDATFKTDLRAWWPLDETSGTRQDKHTFANHLTDVNTVTHNDGRVLNPASNGAPVYRWADQSVVGANAESAMTGQQPLYVANALNGLPVIRFDGINDFLRVNPWLAPQLYTVFTVSKFSGAVSAIGLAVNNGGAIQHSQLMRVRDGLATLSATGFDSAGGGAGSFADSIVAGNPFVAHQEKVIRHASQIQLFASGSGGSVGAITGTPNSGSFILEIGEYQLASLPWAGDMSEIIIYDTALSPADQANVEAYLLAKYGV